MSVFYLIYLHNNNIGTLALIVVVSHVSIYLMSLSIKSNIYYSVKITSWCFVLQWSATIFANLRSSLPSNPTENVYNCLGYIFFVKLHKLNYYLILLKEDNQLVSLTLIFYQLLNWILYLFNLIYFIHNFIITLLDNDMRNIIYKRLFKFPLYCLV